MSDRHARNKTELAMRLGYTRTSIYSFMRLPGFPVPDRRGRWNIASCRKFILKAAAKVKGPSERDQMQLSLMALKVRKAEQELVEFERKVREEIRGELLPIFDQGPLLLKSGLGRMRNELCGRFEGMTARQIWRLWRDSERKVFNGVYAELRKRFDVPLSEPTEAGNVVPFSQKQQMAANA